MFIETPLPKKTLALFQRLTTASPPVYVLGRNRYAEQVSRMFEVQAYVDDFASDATYLSKPVIRMRDLPADAIVISCVVDSVPLTGIDKLHKHGVRDVLDYFSLIRLAPEKFGPYEHCTGNREDILENAPQYKWIYERLADETSRWSFAKLVQFRLTMDVENMRGFTLATDRQYFEDFLPLGDNEVFVDGGGYDGHTTLQFAARHPAYRRVHYFEPTPVMMERSRGSLAGLREVCFAQKGLYSRNETLRFNAGSGAASSISANGDTEIEVVRLDDEVSEPISFLKLDIEGAEYDALTGAAEHIRSSSPTLAVCVYHKQQDFWRIPQQVLAINPGYKIYLRHYSESVRETVMFFIPNKQ